jgi:arylsulfatase A-like enzyme
MKMKYLKFLAIGLLFSGTILVGLGVYYQNIHGNAEGLGHGKRPNIVLILVDDLGYGDLGCYGSKDIKTPHVDELAKQGVRLTDAYANAPVCSPSRAALITGHYPQRAGIEWIINYGDKKHGLPANKNSLPNLLKGVGYKTALFGKWHLGYKDEFGPNAHGFDTFFGFLAADLDYYSHKEATGEPGLYENTHFVEEKGYLTDLITQRSVNFIQQHAGDEPFFLEIAYNAPHWPFQRPNRPDDVRNKTNYSPDHGTRADYIEMVEHLDRGIGEVLQTLESTGLDKNTLVIFYSDNGGGTLSNNGPLAQGKYSLTEGGIRVPCIMRWPNVLPAEKVSAQPIITMDLTASIVSAAKSAAPDFFADGENVLPYLAGTKPQKERTFFWRIPTGQKAVRQGKWKYLQTRDRVALFDLEKDPGEQTNVAFQNSTVCKEFRVSLAAWEKQVSPPRKMKAK